MTDPTCPFCNKLASLAELPADEVVWQFPQSVAFLGPWQYYRGYCILVSRTHATELFQLSDESRRAYLEEMSALAMAIAECFRPHKLNYELLGNQVPHLHWHVFPRYSNEANRLKPVWLELELAAGDEIQRVRLETGPLGRAEISERLRAKLRELS